MSTITSAETGRQLAGKVADYIELHPEGYDQKNIGVEGEGQRRLGNGVSARSIKNSSAPACVAGLAIRLTEQEFLGHDNPCRVAANVLSLSCDEAEWLFATRRKQKTVLKVLRRYADGGKIRWYLPGR